MPTLNLRKAEAQKLILAAVAYMEEFDYKMHEMCQNLINWFKEFTKNLEENRERKKQSDIEFKLKLATCGDSHDEKVAELEEELEIKVESMKRSIHHIELNERLQICFDQLDKITRQYRDYNQHYIQIVNDHPGQTEELFNSFEKSVLKNFKMYDESKREEIQALFKRETAQRQAKLEKEALAKFEAE